MYMYVYVFVYICVFIGANLLGCIEEENSDILST